MEHKGLDEKDRQLLRLLRENARLSYSELGQSVGLTRAAVRTRVKALEDSGVIRGYHADIDPTAPPEAHLFIAQIETDAPSFQEITEKLKAEERVVTLHEITPGCMLHAICTAESRAEMKHFLARFRDRTPGVQRLWLYEVFEALKGSVL